MLKKISIMELKLLIAVILTTTMPIMSGAQNNYPPTRHDLLRLFYQYMEWQSNYQYPTAKRETVNENYLGVKAKGDHRRIKNGKDSSLLHFRYPDFQAKDTVNAMSGADKEIYKLIYHE